MTLRHACALTNYWQQHLACDNYHTIMQKSIRLGFLTHLEGDRDPRQVYEDALTLFAAADQLGFDVGWIAQHHFRTHPGRLPSPFPFLAAAAQRTKRLRLGTAVVTLPLEQPLRVAEDAAVVDLLSDGRLELGLGSGTEPGEFRAFGIEQSQRRQLTTDGVQQVQAALRGEALTESGERLDPPAPTLIDRLWQSGNRKEQPTKFKHPWRNSFIKSGTRRTAAQAHSHASDSRAASIWQPIVRQPSPKCKARCWSPRMAW